jgi:transcriptional regulator with XRE-family HTH domain
MDPNPSTDEPDAAALAYNRRVGALLRLARKHRGLSLHEVEARTGQEFKASVLGAYERGEVWQRLRKPRPAAPSATHVDRARRDARKEPLLILQP